MDEIAGQDVQVENATPVTLDENTTAPQDVTPETPPTPEPVPEVSSPENQADLSGFNSCTRCGREKVKLTQVLSELLCAVCHPTD